MTKETESLLEMFLEWDTEAKEMQQQQKEQESYENISIRLSPTLLPDPPVGSLG